MSHWRYEIEGLFGEIDSVSCFAATHIPTRYDEYGQKYQVTADDAAYVT
jgi:hypothetical protein